MKLIPPAEFAGPTNQRPDLNIVLSVVNPANTDEEWPITLRIRMDSYDIATRPDDVPDDPLESTMVLRQDGTVWEFPVTLEPMDGPVLSWRVLYRGAPCARDIRREWRNTSDTFTGFVHLPEEGSEQRVPSRSYDFSLSAIRFFSPWRLAIGDKVVVRWQLDHEWVEGTMRVVRADFSLIWWRKQQGYHVVGQWEHLSPEMQHVWRSYCWRNQPDGTLDLAISR